MKPLKRGFKKALKFDRKEDIGRTVSSRVKHRRVETGTLRKILPSWREGFGV